jgi:hypothetical protein
MRKTCGVAVHYRQALLSIRVGRKQTAAAPYCIRNPAEIGRLLETLVALRGSQRA